MSEETCIACRRPVAKFTCELCQEPVCKDCRQFVESDTFSFFKHGTKELPPELSHTYYCSGCMGSTVEPALENYREVMARAKTTFFFTPNYKRPLPIVKKSKTAVQVGKCADRDETILRLAFQAAELGFNSVIEAVVDHQKINVEGYRHTEWKGKGYPALLDEVRLARHEQQDSY